MDIPNLIAVRNELRSSRSTFATHPTIRLPPRVDKACPCCYQAIQLSVSAVERSSCRLEHSPWKVIRIHFLRRHWISVRTLGEAIRAGIQDSNLVGREPRRPLRSESCCSRPCQGWVYVCAKPTQQDIGKDIRE